MKFSFSKAASTLSLAALGVAAATSAQAAISELNVEITKVTLVKNAADLSAGTAVVFDPVSNIGGSANVTVDLLDTNSRNGVNVPLRNLTTAEAGVYRTAIVEFASFTSKDEDGNDVPVPGTILPTETHILTNNRMIVIGDDGAELTTIASANPAPIAAMQPIVTAGGVVTLPALDIQIPAASVVEGAGNAATFTQAPAFETVARSSATATDDTTALDYRATIAGSELNTAFADATLEGTTGTLTVGLFGATGLAGKAVATETFEVAYAATTGAIADDATVTFVDAPRGTHSIVVWKDDNSNAKVDAGEKFSSEDVADITAGAATFAAGDATVTDTSTDMVDSTSATGGTLAKLAIDLALAPATVMPTPTLTVNLGIDDEIATDDSSVLAVTLSGTTAAAGADSVTGTVTVTVGSADFALPVLWEEVGGDDTFADTEVATPVLTTGYADVVSAIPAATYTTGTEVLSIALPFTAITGVDANGALGTTPTLDVNATISRGPVSADPTAASIAGGTVTDASDLTPVNTDLVAVTGLAE